MIEAAQRKLREAQFFYGHLVNERKRAYNHEPDAFRFYFSAFIAAARSVTWVMKNEDKEKYDAWKPVWEKQLTDDDKELERFTNELRLDAVKRQGADIIVEPEEVAINELFRDASDIGRSHLAYPLQYLTPFPGGPALPTAKRPAYYLKQEDGKAKVLAICEKYLNYLKKKVGAFQLALAERGPDGETTQV